MSSLLRTYSGAADDVAAAPLVFMYPLACIPPPLRIGGVGSARGHAPRQAAALAAAFIAGMARVSSSAARSALSTVCE